MSFCSGSVSSAGSVSCSVQSWRHLGELVSIEGLSKEVLG